MQDEMGTKRHILGGSNPFENSEWDDSGLSSLRRDGTEDANFPNDMATGKRDGDGDDDGDDDDDTSSMVSVASVLKRETEEMEMQERLGLVAKIKRISSHSGINSRLVNATWSLDELHAEFTRLHNEISIKKSIKFQRRMLLTFSAGVEYAHNRTPFKGKLEGWGEAVLSSIDEFDPVFERLHEKHAPKVGMGPGGKQQEPELELLYLLAYNAFSHAITSSIANLATKGLSKTAGVFENRMQAGKSDSDKFISASETFVTRASMPAGGGKTVLNL